MEDRWGTPPVADDRLSALRSPVGPMGQLRVEEPKKRRTIKELLLGFVLVMIGCGIAFVFLGRIGGGKPITRQSVETTVAPTPTGLGKGMALFAALLEAGSYPPSIREGDTVMVIVTPDPSSDQVTRALTERATVMDVAETATITGGVVVSMVGPQTMSRDIADAAKVHLSVVGGGE